MANDCLPVLNYDLSSAMTQEQSISILTALRGQSIALPDLNAILDGWPREVNRSLDRLRHDVDEWLDRYDIVDPQLKVSCKVSHGWC